MLRYLVLGWDITNIADEMGLSPHTVRNHSTNLRRKLDVGSSLEAVMAALVRSLTLIEWCRGRLATSRLFDRSRIRGDAG